MRKKKDMEKKDKKELGASKGMHQLPWKGKSVK